MRRRLGCGINVGFLGIGAGVLCKDDDRCRRPGRGGSARRRMWRLDSPLASPRDTGRDHWFPAWRSSDRFQVRNILLTCVSAAGIEPATPRLYGENEGKIVPAPRISLGA